MAEVKTPPAALDLSRKEFRAEISGENNRVHLGDHYGDTIIHQNSPRTPNPGHLANVNLLRDLRLWARYEDIEEAHKNTFQGILGGGCKPWDDFAQFLSSDEGIYWISGKAASGKSTLMKYLFDNKPKLKEYLSSWSNGIPLSISTFFFWSGGSRAQRSQEGLFRCLLWQVLRMEPDLVKVVFPMEWEEFFKDAEEGYNSTGITWNLTMLTKGFEILVGLTAVSTKHFLIIDGLDEYEGDHAYLAENFKKLSKSPHVKVCVASRPWVVFEKQFSALPKLRLQDITAGDIERYVNDSLYQGKRLSGLRLSRPDLAKELVDEIVEHADGVFLWVKLVVQSLLEGFGNDDDLAELQSRMRLLPRELTELYTYMLDSNKNGPYFKAASQIFRLRQASDLAENMLVGNSVGGSPAPFGLLDLYFATSNLPKSGLEAKVALLSEKDTDTWCVQTEKSLRKKCAGLLEVNGVAPNRYTYIRYLHRTVKEYLERKDVDEAIVVASIGTSFDPHLCLVQACLMKLKGICTEMTWDMNELQSTLMLALMHARLSEEARTAASLVPSLDEVLLLDEIDGTMTTILAEFSVQRNMPWFYQPDLLQRDRYSGESDDSFLALAVQLGLNQYIETKVKRNPRLTVQRTRGRPLLHHAVHALLRGTLPVTSFSGSALVPQLLKNGADPNQIFNGCSIWHYFLTSLHTLVAKNFGRGEETFSFAQLAITFIKMGADLTTEIQLSIAVDEPAASQTVSPPALLAVLFSKILAVYRLLEREVSEKLKLEELLRQTELEVAATGNSRFSEPNLPTPPLSPKSEKSSGGKIFRIKRRLKGLVLGQRSVK